jgi:hypothetical protein
MLLLGKSKRFLVIRPQRRAHRTDSDLATSGRRPVALQLCTRNTKLVGCDRQIEPRIISETFPASMCWQVLNLSSLFTCKYRSVFRQESWSIPGIRRAAAFRSNSTGPAILSRSFIIIASQIFGSWLSTDEYCRTILRSAAKPSINLVLTMTDTSLLSP